MEVSLNFRFSLKTLAGVANSKLAFPPDSIHIIVFVFVAEEDPSFHTDNEGNVEEEDPSFHTDNEGNKQSASLTPNL